MSASSSYLNVLTRLESAKAANQAQAIRARAQATAGAQQANAGLWGNTIANIGQMVSQIPQQRAELDRIKNQAEETKLRREQMEREAAREKRSDQEEQTIRDLYSTAAQEYQQQSGPTGALPQPINAPTGGQMLPQSIDARTGGEAFGLRSDGTPKGNGFLGPIQRPDGKVSSEISVGVEIDGKEVEIPTLVPTLTKEERDWLINNDVTDPKQIPDSIIQKAVDYARPRIAAGKSPFAGPEESPRAAAPTTARKSPFPTPSELMSKLSPKTAISLINAQAALQKVDPKADPKTKVEQLQTFYKGFQRMPHDMKVAAYPALLDLFEKNEYVPVGVLPREWSDETEAFIMGTRQGAPNAPKVAQITTVGPDGKPVTKFVEETPGAEYPQVPKEATNANPTEASLALAAAKGDKDAARALALIRAQRVGSGGGDKDDVNGLVATVLENPALWDQLTPTVRGKIAPELRARGYTNFGKPLSEAAMKQIAESNSAIDSLTDLRSVLKENEQYIGPIAGLSAMNPYSGARQAQAKIDLVRQRVGKALEGGVLRKEDEEKYKKILATLRDTPETAVYKVDQLIKNIQNNVDQFKAAQRLGGKNLDLTGSQAPSATPAAPAGNGSVSVQAPNGKTYVFKSKADADAFKAKAGIP